ncbi:MAG: hypothetical protein AABY55_01760, partial [Candidatus Omnitrophota bacterium]
MEKIKKGYNLKIIAIFIAFIFSFESTGYFLPDRGIFASLGLASESLRAPTIGNYKRIEEALDNNSPAVETQVNVVLVRYPNFSDQKERLRSFISSITPEKFGAAFVNNPRDT